MNKGQIIPFPTQTTERLILRNLTEEDESKIFEIRSNTKVNKFLERKSYTKIEEAKDFITKIKDGIQKNAWIYWAISKKNVPELIGTICLWNFSEDRTRADIGFEMLPAHQGKGLMKEAVNAVLKYGFEKLNLDSIDGEVDPKNERSINLMKKFNFILQDEQNKTSSAENIKPVFVVYRLSKQSWLNQK